MPSATIKIYLVHGDPKRLRTAELSNWNGKAVAAPRSEFDDLLRRSEATHSGVYLLTGVDAETAKSVLYVGEAESLRDRLRIHLEKDYWNHIVFFMSKDENLTKAHIRYLEGQIIELARAAGRADLKNGQSSGSRLPESDVADMQVFLEKLQQLLPALGVELLVSQADLSPSPLLYCEIRGLQARGHTTPNGIVVLKGSQAVLNEREAAHRNPWVINRRRQLKEDGIVVSEADCLRFVKDIEFPSASTAAAIIHGGPVNGLIHWKTEDGTTLRQLEEKP